jgi:hypothetical protein
MSIGRAHDHIIGFLGTGLLGGTQVWVDVALRHPDGSAEEIFQEIIDSGRPDPEDGKYDYLAIAVSKRRRSVRLGVSCRDANLKGDVPQEGEVPWHGNAVLPLAEGYALIVSCSGLSDDNDELVSYYVGYGILLKLQQALARPAAQ